MEKDYLLQQWLANKLTDEERQAFELLEDYDMNREIIDSARYFKASHFSKAPSYETMEARLAAEVPVKRLQWMIPLLRLTGALVIGLGIYFLFFFNNITEVATLASQKTTVELPDASTVTLNALTTISYHKKKWDRNREVNLDGEAYFKVAKGATFDVITSEGVVTVVGTQFNVKQREQFFEVKCYEGIVKVTTKNETKELRAGESFRLLRGTSSLWNTIYQSPQWTKNVSDFKSVPFREVVSELERQYNLTVLYDDIYAERLFTGGFVHNSLENALKSITEPQKLTYTIESSNQVRLKIRGE